MPRAGSIGLFCVAVALMALGACAVSSGPPKSLEGDVAGVARAERAFAASAQSGGVNAAFMAVLAPNSTLFRPGPVDGKAFLKDRPEGPFRLEWQPQRVTAARTGDLGYSTGPYRLTLDAKPGQPLHGQFMTVWKRGALDRWEVLIDHGIGHPAAIGWDSFEVIAPDTGPAPQRSLVAAEAEFSRRAATDGIGEAYRLAASKHLRILRDGLAPIAAGDIRDALPDPGSRWTWTMTDDGVSTSGDLAWVMGRYRSTSSSGYFVRVWRAEGGDWKILADVLAPTGETVR